MTAADLWGRFEATYDALHAALDGLDAAEVDALVAQRGQLLEALGEYPQGEGLSEPARERIAAREAQLNERLANRRQELAAQVGAQQRRGQACVAYARQRDVN